MAKTTTLFSCSHCSYRTIKWLGCCPECNEWDSFVEQMPEKKSAIPSQAAAMQSLDTISTTEKKRMLTAIGEWDRVVGDGIMPGSLLVLTGDPGIGKSTLLLQVSNAIGQHNSVYYFSTEESLNQVKQRAMRLAIDQENILFSDCSSLDAIISTIESNRPDTVFIDSIQNCSISTHSGPGSTAQLREATFQLMRLSKENGITIIITSHITKEGIIAGPKTLEHMVDGVFYLQGEDRFQTRILRAVKNRFGTINELGFFEMTESGMQEVPNINEQVIEQIPSCPGSVLISSIEGSRPLLLEIQALTVQSKLAMPQRVVSGLDHKQVVLIAAILEKYLRIKLSTQDIFVKVSSGLKLKGSASDLGVALALLSSYFQQSLHTKSIALGEIGLTGHIKPVNQAKQCINEAITFGVKHIFIAKNQNINPSCCTIQQFCHVYELLSLFVDKKD